MKALILTALLASGGAAIAQEASYPPCSAAITDKCVQSTTPRSAPVAKHHRHLPRQHHALAKQAR